MKKNMMNIGRWLALMSTILVLGSPLAFTSCKEDISEEAFAVKEMQTMTDYLTADPTLSEIKALFDQVKLGRSANASVLTNVLSARGNYTVFAPQNEAVDRFIQKFTTEEFQNTCNNVAELSKLTEEQRDEISTLIALNCVIDNGSANAYEIAEFPNDGSTFAISNLNDRRLSCVQNEANDYVINGDAVVTQSNIEVSNGMLHIVSEVIAPSTASVAELVKAADNMKIMGALLEATAWDVALAVDTRAEEEYQDENLAYAGTTRRFESVKSDIVYQDKRAVGYTLFAEVDTVYRDEWGIEAIYDEDGNLTNGAAIISAVESKCQQITGNTAATGDYTNPDNALNQFVAYHLLEGAMASDELVHHWNEYGFDYGPDITKPLKTGYSVNVWDYYPTMGEHSRLMKITQIPVSEDGGFYINRVSTYDNAIKGAYTETSWKENTPENGLNVQLMALNGDNENNAVNGFYFPLKKMLIYSNQTGAALGSERIRFDVTCMLPELASNDLRGCSARYFPKGYFKNIMNESTGTQLYYLKDGYTYFKGGWRAFQGDEMNITGRYDFVYKLPPIPATGSYELRMGCQNNLTRGMIQVYLGEDPNTTVPIGLPIDQRETVDLIPGQPWVADNDLDDVTIRENDRKLRNQNYMKGPNYICSDGSKGKTPVRNIAGSAESGPALRRILTTHYFDANKTYYLRLKSAIESDKTQFQFDYFELVPTTVVNGAEPEDIW